MYVEKTLERHLPRRCISCGEKPETAACVAAPARKEWDENPCGSKPIHFTRALIEELYNE